MELILWRHAEAEEGLDDAARQLTKRGRKQAAQVAKWLKARLPERCEILVSPSRRTQQTADALGLPYHTTRKAGLGASPADVIAAAGWPQREGAVLIVGHQPTLGQVAARILSDTDSEWAVKKGAVWWIASRPDHGGEITLRAVITPELV